MTFQKDQFILLILQADLKRFALSIHNQLTLTDSGIRDLKAPISRNNTKEKQVREMEKRRKSKEKESTEN